MTSEKSGALQALLVAVIGIAIFSAVRGCRHHGVHLQGEGATFPLPIYARWIGLFQREYPDVKVSYTPVGSTRGILAVGSRKAHFGACDALPTESQRKDLPGKLLAMPTVLGPVVLAYNLPGFAGELTLSGPVVADIYLGKITHWNDPRLAEINQGSYLPDTPIRVAHRLDGSGTTAIFTDYLASVSDEWREDVGCGQRVVWPTGNQWAGDGNDGVAHRILLLPGGIGYVELKYAQNAGLKYAALINQAGNRVWPTVESVQEAEANTPAEEGRLIKPSIVNAPGEHSYPICGFTYLLVYEDLTYLENPAEQHALIEFLKWILDEGQRHAAGMHYTPLPDALREQALQQVKDIKTAPLQAESLPPEARL
jgi:phosphate transport system substrate-binding protein